MNARLPSGWIGTARQFRCASRDDLRHAHHVSPAITICVGLIDWQQRFVIGLPQQRFVEAHVVPADEDTAALAPSMHFGMHKPHHLEMRERAGGDVGNRGAGDQQRPWRRHDVGQQPAADIKCVEDIEFGIGLDGRKLQDLVECGDLSRRLGVVENIGHDGPSACIAIIPRAPLVVHFIVHSEDDALFACPTHRAAARSTRECVQAIALSLVDQGGMDGRSLGDSDSSVTVVSMGSLLL